MSKRSVLLVSSEFPPGPGGIGAHAAALATGLAERGWGVIVNTPMDFSADEEVELFQLYMTRLGVDVDRLGRGPWNLGPGRIIRLRRLAMQAQVDVVIASGRIPQNICSVLCWMLERPLVAVVHGTELGTGKRAIDYLTCRAITSAQLVVPVSRFTERRLQGSRVSPREVRVIPNGADPAGFESLSDDKIRVFREQHGIGRRPLVVTIGQLSERKAQDTIIRALPLLRSRVPDVLYVAVGLPTRTDELRALSQRLGVSEQVRMPGVVSPDERRHWLYAADVFALTSRITATGECEGYGIAAVEAAFCGTPAVVSDGSGLVEAIVPNRTGLVVPPDDPPAVAAALALLLTDQELRDSMGQAARERAYNEQTWAHRVTEWDRTLRALIEKGDHRK